MEGGQGGMGIAVQQMIAEKSKEGSKGGVVSIADPVKFEGTSPVEQIIGGGIQGAGQGIGGGFGLVSGNAADALGMGGFTGVNIVGDLMSDIKGKLQELQNPGYLSLKGQGEDMLQGGASAFDGASPAIQMSPDATPHAVASQGPAMGE